MGLLPCCCVNGNNKAEVPFLLNIRWLSMLYYKQVFNQSNNFIC